MSSKKIVIVLIALAFVMVPLLAAEGNDGAVKPRSETIEVGGFNERSNGTISLTLENTDTSPVDVIVFVTYLHSDGRLAETNIAIPAKEGDTNGSVDVSLSFRIGSPGTYFVEVFVTEEDGTLLTQSGSLEVNVGSSIWANTTTYIIIIIVIVVIGIAIWLKLRSNATKKKDTGGVFTAMEAQKKASKEKKQYDDVQDTEYTVTETDETATTEKKEYSGRAVSTKKKTTSSKRKSDPSSRRSSKRK